QVPDEAAEGGFRRARPLSAWALDARDSHTVVAVNRLLAAGHGASFRDGSFTTAQSPEATAVLTAAAAELGVRVREVPGGPAGRALRPVRLGLFDTFGGHMPTGWDQWLLQEFGFPVRQVWGDRIEAGDLRRDYDVLVFHTGLPGPRDLQRAATRRDEEKIPELKQALPPFEDWSNLEARATRLTGEKSLPALREFVANGGTLIALGGEVEKVIRHFELPVKVGTYVPTADGERRTTREEFYVPGSLLAIEVDTAHPAARGCPREIATMVNNGSAILEVTDPNAKIDVLARYRGMDTLVSGWAIGEEYLVGKAAALCAHVGKGRIYLFGADVTYRGQPLASFKLFFHAILGAGSDG
ncbi:MAG: hypothetical protein JNK15_20715, partial [Planctomycetes bacterium]|nr:hypothetical protein [Planctomycetota bacterium]